MNFQAFWLKQHWKWHKTQLHQSINLSFHVFVSGVVFRCFMSKFGCRICVMLGGLISAGGLALSVFVTDLYQLYLTYGLMTGKYTLIQNAVLCFWMNSPLHFSRQTVFYWKTWDQISSINYFMPPFWQISSILVHIAQSICFSLWTLYSIDTHFDASTTDSFWKHCGKRRNCS